MADAKSPFKTDLLKYYLILCGTDKPSLAQKIRLWFESCGLHSVAMYRFGQFAQRWWQKNKLLGLPLFIIHKFFFFFMATFYHMHIHADIGPGLFIGHIGTIYIGPCEIGDNFTITHNVTIGVGHSRSAEGIPKIGNNVWIGTGSVISGAITIGNGVTISNGTMLSRSVPDGCLVGGNPGRVIMREYDNRELLVLPPLN
jgi:serine O-acetyltransferase